jgi:kynurenine formamidase
VEREGRSPSAFEVPIAERIAGMAIRAGRGKAQPHGPRRDGNVPSHLTASAASFLAARGAAIVGIDSHNIDDTDDRTRPVHSILLRAGIPVVEHLTNLEALPPSGFRFYAVPVKVEGMGTFPVRAFAEIA